MGDLVSIIVPSYNYSKYIKECILSIYNQSYSDIELIVIDDCSKDDSTDIIDEMLNRENFKQRFVNCVFLKNDVNHGAHYTINRGIELSKGKFVSVINADDLYAPNRIESLLKTLLLGDGDLVFSKIEVIDEYGEKLYSDEANNFRGVSQSALEKRYISHALLYQNCSISTGNLLFKKDIYFKLNGFRVFKYVHDWDFLLRASLIKEPYYDENTIYYYRIHSSNSYKALQGVAEKESEAVLTNVFYQIKRGVSNPYLARSLVQEEVKNTFLYTYWKRANIFSRLKNEILFKLSMTCIKDDF